MCETISKVVYFKLVGVWFVNQWITSGKNNIQLVELGPGRGTLASDILRVGHFNEFQPKIRIN